MVCEKCAHHCICSLLKDYTAYIIEPPGWGGATCKYFKCDTTVPFVIGQPVWKLYEWRWVPELLEGRVSMIQQKADKSWNVRISDRYGTTDFKAGDIGKHIFLTKEAAEEALVLLNEQRAKEGSMP